MKNNSHSPILLWLIEKSVAHPNHFPRELLRLTHRELQVLRLMADDLTNQEIATRLFIEPGSVDNYKNRMADKLNRHGTRQLYRFAFDVKTWLTWPEEN